jgi:hypothetical protein
MEEDKKMARKATRAGACALSPCIPDPIGIALEKPGLSKKGKDV